MAKEATLQVRMDAQLKQDAEQLFRELGTSFSEAVRIFARQSVLERRIPFAVGEPAESFRSPLQSRRRSVPNHLAAEDAPSAFGMLSDHSSPEKRACEREAWGNAASIKHAGRRGCA